MRGALSAITHGPRHVHTVQRTVFSIVTPNPPRQAIPANAYKSVLMANGRLAQGVSVRGGDRKSTRLNSSHVD